MSIPRSPVHAWQTLRSECNGEYNSLAFITSIKYISVVYREMPRADGYKTLPDDNDAGERTEDRGEAEADGAPTRREGTAAGAAPSSAGAGSTEAG